MLRHGSSGSAVIGLQTALNERDSAGLSVDGIFGPLTTAAVQAFQRHMGLTADGVVGPATWQVLTLHFVPLGKAGPGFYWYGSTNTMAYYGTANTIATLQEVTRQWQEEYPGYRLGVGDISNPHGGYLPGHVSHRLGVDLDLRLMRKDGREAPSTYQDSSYSRALTQELVDRLLATGEVETIFFNDMMVLGVSPWPNHDDHLHVRFLR